MKLFKHYRTILTGCLIQDRGFDSRRSHDFVFCRYTRITGPTQSRVENEKLYYIVNKRLR